ncbi:MAG: DNA topoisomerase I [Candidatus Thorarchaeota archaeon]|jgi:DNA topoisomerase-1
MESFEHKGIIVIKPAEPHHFEIVVRGEQIFLNQLQEEMAVAWVRKLGTPYVEDPVFIRNFFSDFSKALKVRPALGLDEVDFSSVIKFVEEERAMKEGMTKEEKRAAREARKAERDQLKEEFGYALVDGERMELGNYQTEPSGIFMGRGEHPLRGRWKQGAREKDITLNLSPDTEVPEGDWGKIEWAPDSMWVAKWTDELTKSTKYIWLHDSTPIKQEREAAKFDKAMKVAKKIDAIREHIMDGIHSGNSKTRMIAAACYLIDRLSLRVGDEKDPDEADTVGATTLRAEHLTFTSNSVVFDFLGKDSVTWHKEMELSPDVYEVFKELYDNAVERVESFRTRSSRSTRVDPKKPAQIFPSVGSTQVNRFLSGFDKDLTAKVFRTFHATLIMKEELRRSRAKRTDPDFIKKEAVKRANLEVARVMNHTKQAPKGWSKTSDRYRERISKASDRIKKAENQLSEKRKKLRALKKKEKDNLASRLATVAKQKEIVEKNKKSVAMWREKRNSAKATWDNARDRKRRTRGSKRKGKTTKKQRLEDAQDSIDRTRARLDRSEESLARARERYNKSRESLEKKQQVLADFREKSAVRISRSEKTVRIAKERVDKAKLAKKKIETDFSLARDSRIWNLGTSLKSYIHPKTVYKWCEKVDYPWRKVYPATLQRKFAWVESSS